MSKSLIVNNRISSILKPLAQIGSPSSQGHRYLEAVRWFGRIRGVLPVRVVPTAADGLTAISSHLREAHSSLSIRLTPARDFTVCRRYLEHNPEV